MGEADLPRECVRDSVRSIFLTVLAVTLPNRHLVGSKGLFSFTLMVAAKMEGDVVMVVNSTIGTTCVGATGANPVPLEDEALEPTEFTAKLEEMV